MEELKLDTLLPIKQEENGNTAVDARMLYSFLESRREFTTWIKDRIQKCDLIENEDFTSFDKIVKREKGATVLKEYALSLDAAKEISMMEGNERGKQARRYFINCEKKLRKVTTFNVPQTFAEVLRLAADQQEKIEAQQKLIEEQKPAIEVLQLVA